MEMHRASWPRPRSPTSSELNQNKSESCYVTFGATVIANHHGVDARQRTVQAPCQICSQYSQTITAWTRDTERYWPSRARFAVSVRKPSRRGREARTERCTNRNPELNKNESDPDFLGVTIACPSMMAAMRKQRCALTPLLEIVENDSKRGSSI